MLWYGRVASDFNERVRWVIKTSCSWAAGWLSTLFHTHPNSYCSFLSTDFRSLIFQVEKLTSPPHGDHQTPQKSNIMVKNFTLMNLLFTTSSSSSKKKRAFFHLRCCLIWTWTTWDTQNQNSFHSSDIFNFFLFFRQVHWLFCSSTKATFWYSKFFQNDCGSLQCDGPKLSKKIVFQFEFLLVAQWTFFFLLTLQIFVEAPRRNKTVTKSSNINFSFDSQIFFFHSR